MPDYGISASQAVNFGEVNGAYYPHAIEPASGSVATATHDQWGKAMVGGAGYYMRPDFVLLNNALNCHEIKFLFSGSADEAIAMTGEGWVSFGSASYMNSGSLRLDISPIAWAGTECAGSNLNANCGSGSVIFVYNSSGRTI